MRLIEVSTYEPLALIFTDVEAVVTDDLRDCEEAWNGGIADFGDPTAAEAIKNVPGYDRYVDALRASVAARIGFPLVVYRLTDREAFLDWQADGHSQNIAASLNERVARNFRNFAGASQRAQVLVKFSIERPDAIVMRGKLSKQELVLDSGWIDTSCATIVDDFS